MGLGPGLTQPGDLICVLFRGRVLYVFSPVEHGLLFIGECYIHGLMDGEAMSLLESGDYSEQEFNIV